MEKKNYVFYWASTTNELNTRENYVKIVQDKIYCKINNVDYNFCDWASKTN